MAAWLLGTAKQQKPSEIIAAVIASLDIAQPPLCFPSGWPLPTTNSQLTGVNPNLAAPIARLARAIRGSATDGVTAS
jgi:hypothetical protein